MREKYHVNWCFERVLRLLRYNLDPRAFFHGLYSTVKVFPPHYAALSLFQLFPAICCSVVSVPVVSRHILSRYRSFHLFPAIFCRVSTSSQVSLQIRRKIIHFDKIVVLCFFEFINPTYHENLTCDLAFLFIPITQFFRREHFSRY